MGERQTRAERQITAATCKALLDAVIEPVREVAREEGYSIAVHGSLARDIDLVAVPWTERAGDPVDLVKAIRAVVISIVGRCYVYKEQLETGGTKKPHGRRAFTLMTNIGDVYFDLSVMPRLAKPEAVD